MVIMNKTDIRSFRAVGHYNNATYATANRIMDKLYDAYVDCDGELFSPPTVPMPDGDEVVAKQVFKVNYLAFMSDLGSAAIVASRGGVPIPRLRGRWWQFYEADQGPHGLRGAGNHPMFFTYFHYFPMFSYVFHMFSFQICFL